MLNTGSENFTPYKVQINSIKLWHKVAIQPFNTSPAGTFFLSAQGRIKFHSYDSHTGINQAKKQHCLL